MENHCHTFGELTEKFSKDKRVPIQRLNSPGSKYISVMEKIDIKLDKAGENKTVKLCFLSRREV